MRNCLKMGMLATFMAALPSAASAQGSMQMKAAELTLTYLEEWSSDQRTTLAEELCGILGDAVVRRRGLMGAP